MPCARFGLCASSKQVLISRKVGLQRVLLFISFIFEAYLFCFEKPCVKTNNDIAEQAQIHGLNQDREWHETLF